MQISFRGHHRMIVLHLIFWVLYFTYRIYDLQGYIGIDKAIAYVSIPLVSNLIASYTHYFFILPLWLSRQRIKTYATATLALLVIVVVMRIIIENQLYPMIVKNETYFQTVKLTRIISTLWDTIAFILFTGMIRFTVDRFDLESKQKQLQNEKLTAELNYLKAQINPHFLFNTLHNLNYLVYSRSTLATEVIIKLSGIMRYMIDEVNKSRVQLQQEVEYLSNYIHLESIRLTNPFELTFEKEGDFALIEIAPLTLIPLVENAFKHGVQDRTSGCWIKIRLEVREDKILFDVSNRILPIDPSRPASGFGLENLKKRLALSYPHRHHFVMSQQNSVHSVKLILDV
jgi:LytS/YehU family sensor histidine kinase